jgi:hypothetical protein
MYFLPIELLRYILKFNGEWMILGDNRWIDIRNLAQTLHYHIKCSDKWMIFGDSILVIRYLSQLIQSRSSILTFNAHIKCPDKIIILGILHNFFTEIIIWTPSSRKLKSFYFTYKRQPFHRESCILYF